MGADVARTVRGLPVLAGSGGRTASVGATVQIGGRPLNGHPTLASPEQIGYEAQQAVLARGQKLTNEEMAKGEKNPLDMWDEIANRSQAGEFPKGTDVFLTKFHGLFYVAPAQDAFMCRLRIPGGQLQAYQLTGLAKIAADSAGGYIDITTRANLQLREIPASKAMDVLYAIRDVGLMSLGSGGDNIRNVTASPLSGLDPLELVETLPLAKRMHHYICQHREMYGLPRKFNIAFEGGGQISSLDDTNDIGFRAVHIRNESSIPSGVYYQLTLGGITGHGDFARDTGIILTTDEVLPVAGAIVRVFIQHGDRTDRKKARLKYVLDAWGFEKFIDAVEQELGRQLRRVPSDAWEHPQVENRFAHVDFHPQKQAGKYYVGVVFPVGRMTSEQAIGLAEIASQFGSSELRLTVWQNLIIPNINAADCDAVREAILALGLECNASSFRAGLVACTGNAGCKFAASNTKRHAMEIARYLEERFELDQPINIHLTGCHHSCAQHYIGDIGLIGSKVEVNEELVEGYDIFVGGGWGAQQSIGRRVCEKITAQSAPQVVAEIVRTYTLHRAAGESFNRFISRLSDEEVMQLWPTKPQLTPLVA